MLRFILFLLTVSLINAAETSKLVFVDKDYKPLVNVQLILSDKVLSSDELGIIQVPSSILSDTLSIRSLSFGHSKILVSPDREIVSIKLDQNTNGRLIEDYFIKLKRSQLEEKVRKRTSISGYVVNQSSEAINDLDIYLDNKNYNFRTSTFTIKEIDPGTHKIRISNFNYYDTTFTILITDGLNELPRITLRLDSSNFSEREAIVMARKISTDDKFGTETAMGKSDISITGSDYSVIGARAESLIISVDGMETESKFSSGFASVESFDEFPSDDIYTKNEALQKEHGLLTAGKINDLEKWDLWNDLNEGEFEQFSRSWNIKTKERYTLIAKNNLDFPLQGVKVELLDKDQTVLWTSITDNLGRAEMWNNVFEVNQHAKSIRWSYQDQTGTLRTALPIYKGINLISVPIQCSQQYDLDISFVVDATGSMGDEIEYLKSELLNISNEIKDSLEQYNIKYSSVFFRDLGDEYLTREEDFTDPTNLNSFIHKQSANGGGDYPEAVHSALKKAIYHLSWRDNSTKLLFLVLDAPPHDNIDVLKELQLLIKEASSIGIRIIPIASSGVNKSTEFFLRSISMLTLGDYIFLTDDSGIGTSHIKPSTDDYQVKSLTTILTETIVYRTKHLNCDLVKTKEQLEKVYSRDYIDKHYIKSDNSESFPEIITLTAYPNPNNGILKIRADGILHKIVLLDQTGRLIMERDYNKSEVELDLRNLPNGAYTIMNISNEGNRSGINIILNK